MRIEKPFKRETLETGESIGAKDPELGRRVYAMLVKGYEDGAVKAIAKRGDNNEEEKLGSKADRIICHFIQ